MLLSSRAIYRREYMMTAPIEVHQLSVNYGHRAILWDLTFEVPAGRLVGIIGPNGAGKSTLIRTLVGMIQPLTGQIVIGRQLLTPAVATQIAYVPQRNAVDWDFPITVKELVMMGRYRMRGLFRRMRKEDQDSTEKALVKVGLWDQRDRQIGQLSGGQQQRAFLARALVQNANYYFFDEPFAGVDLATERELIKIMQDLRDRGKTLLCVHHDLTTVTKIFDEALILNTSLIACGPVQEVFNRDHLSRAYGSQSGLFDEMMERAHLMREGGI